MTYELLMAHAAEIQRLASEVAMVGLRGDAGRQAAVEREFADVPDAFRALTGFPDPGRFDAMADGVTSVLRGLSTGDGGDPAVPADPELARFLGTAGALRVWTGPAADRFRTGFLEPWPALVRNQYAIAAVLRSALRAQQEIWARARQDADRIAEQAIGALGACGDCTRTEWSVTFTVVASVAAVAAVPLGGAAALAVGGVAAVAQVVAATGPAEPPQTAFSADDPVEVVERVREAIGLLRGHIRERRDAVAAALATTGRLMDDRPEWFGWR
ncbi:hypothetical protein ABT297_31160 [Dactylosporangium sp. NPDC000555]|uniref:hypothetical protein n=1 Tax=Dactylosporangium sp. NPDC000555 TaxID=3154260 RepID=UPI003320E624